jgi:LemA protein
MIVSPDVPEAAAAVTHHQILTIMLPLGLILFFSFVVEEISARAEQAVWGTSMIVGWVNNRIVVLRVWFIAILFLFYAYEAAWWFNMDMSELNTIAVGSAQVLKEFQRRADIVPNMDAIVNNYASHERVLFEHVSDMRSQLKGLEAAGGTPSFAQRAKLQQAFMSLSALAEQYPDLKAEQRFQDTMDMAVTTEDRIADVMYAYLDAIIAYDACNQCYWCNYWTYLVAPIVPLPAFWVYFHTDYKNAPSESVEDVLFSPEGAPRMIK